MAKIENTQCNTTAAELMTFSDVLRRFVNALARLTVAALPEPLAHIVIEYACPWQDVIVNKIIISMITFWGPRQLGEDRWWLTYGWINGDTNISPQLLIGIDYLSKHNIYTRLPFRSASGPVRFFEMMIANQLHDLILDSYVMNHPDVTLYVVQRIVTSMEQTAETFMDQVIAELTVKK